jgi:predicted transcriptional regulator
MSDAERADRGRAQIAAGNFVEVEDVDAYFYSLQVPVEV